MTRRETSEEIDAAAAEWVARLDREPGDAGVRRELEAWLAADDRRRGAFFRAQATWHLLDRARALPYSPANVGPVNTLSYSRRYLLGFATAASFAAVGYLVLGKHESPQELRTRLGEQRTVAMTDGSTVAMDTATMLQVNLRPTVRLVTLEQGEAWFKVAKDRSRPFIIDAGALTARAVGTAFSVARQDDGVIKVLVTEGIVEVARPGGDPVQITQGMQATLAADRRLHVETLNNDSINRELAWREQKIALDGDTVAQAAEKFNRYNDVKIVLDDNWIGEQKVVGWFNSNDPQAFADALKVPFGVKVVRDGETLHLMRTESSSEGGA